MFPTGLPPSGGSKIDVTLLTPFNSEANVNTSGVLTTLLSITGKGYLDTFYASGNTQMQVKVTVDDNVTVLLSTTGQDPIGVAHPKDFIGTSTAGTSSIRIGALQTTPTGTIAAFKSYPITDNTAGMVILGLAPIYFYKSLKLEYLSNVATARYRYAGAYR